MTHGELVRRAVRWLRNTKRCGVVLTEEYSMGHETPDAIGWKSYASYLVECKATRSDFQKDQRKPVRVLPEYGMGDYRYYMIPVGLLSVDELPEGWGLLEAREKQIRVVKESQRWPITRTALNERPLLYKVLRRMIEEKTDDP